MKYDPEYLDHLEESTLKEKWLDAHIEYDKHQGLAAWSVGLSILLGILTGILIVAHVWLLVIDGTIPSLATFVTLGILSFAAVVVTPSLKQRQLGNHIEDINCALEKAKGGADTHEE